MDRSARRALALVVLAVAALAVTAATIDSTVVSDGGPTGFGSGHAGGAGAGDSPAVGFEPLAGDGGGVSIPTPCLPWLLSPAVLAAIAAAFALVGGLAYRETKSLFAPTAVVLAGVPPVVLLLAFLTSCSRRFSLSSRAAGAVGNVSLFPAGGGGRLVGGEGAAGSVSAPTAAFGVLLVGALVVAAALLVTSTGDDDETADDALPGDDDAPDVAAVARAAGAAAERIESGSGDVENEVFRAWGEMTARLDVPNPQSATPAEFAAAAVDAGMAREDVAELTRLFEEVRYGGFDATADREARAVAALRNVESTYANGAESPRDAAESEGRGR